MADNASPQYEPIGVSRPWLVAGLVIGCLVFALVVMGLLLGLYLPVAPGPIRPETFPDPQLEPAPTADHEKFLQAQHSELTRQGWIDKPAGLAAIPVEKAMGIVASRGSAAFDPLPGITPKPAFPKAGTVPQKEGPR